MILLLTALCEARTFSQASDILPIGGSPFMALPSADGSRLFVSVELPGPRRNEIEVFERRGSDYRKTLAIPVPGDPMGMALTPSGRTLLVASGDYYLAISTQSLNGSDMPPIASIYAGRDTGAVEVVASADGRSAFFSDEDRSSIAVVSLATTASQGALPKLTIAGVIPVDRGPVGLALSPDGRVLYATSELAPGHPVTCDGTPQGSLSIIDAATAERDPRSTLVSSVTAGCQPVRVAVSPDGKTVWVTARGDNELEAFNASALRDDSAHALLARASVGSAPVGLVVTADGRFVLVANSNRFDELAQNSTLSVLDAQAARNGTYAVLDVIQTGLFPRELRESPSRDAIYLTNYSGGTVQIVPEPHGSGAP